MPDAAFMLRYVFRCCYYATMPMPRCRHMPPFRMLLFAFFLRFRFRHYVDTLPFLLHYYYCRHYYCRC